MRMSVTGHRPNKLWDYDLSKWQYRKLKEIIKNIIIQQHVEDLYSGMALGIDILVTDVVIEINESGILDYHINLHCCIPCWRQEAVWLEESRIHFYGVLGKCDEIVIVTKDYYSPKLMQIRNEYMVDESIKLLAIWDGTSGGTGNCVSYANKVGKEIIYINPREISVMDERLEVAYNNHEECVNKLEENISFELYTSYYGNFRSINLDEYLLISVSNSKPDWFIYECIKLDEVVPDWSLVKAYKDGQISEEEYERIYYQKLSGVNKNSLKDKLANLCRSHNKKKVLFLCWEPKGKFCHRTLLLKWIGFGSEL